MDFAEGIFAGADGEFGVISPPSQDIGVGEPELHNVGAAAYERSFTENEGFRPPALNDHGDVAFFAALDTSDSGIFTGPRAGRDRVIVVGDTLGGEVVTNLVLCEAGLNDNRQLAPVAQFQDPVSFQTRTAVYRATRI